jgi:hypothetical protein
MIDARFGQECPPGPDDSNSYKEPTEMQLYFKLDGQPGQDAKGDGYGC